MDNKVNILGVNIDMFTISEAADRIFSFLDKDSFNMVFTPNSEIIMSAYNNPELMSILNSASVLTADGIGVVYASRILRKPLAERCAGFDVAVALLEKLNASEHKLFLFGGKPGIADAAKTELLKTYPNLNIAGTRNGYFKDSESDEIVREINNSGADIIFVCLGAPKQEEWIYKNRNKLLAKAALGIGGSLDIFAGQASRAPKIMQKTGLEWLYRLAKEPWRFRRMMVLPKFGFTVILKGKRCGKTLNKSK